GQILAEEVITANNTSLNNTGKLASNGSINLNNSSLINRSSIESVTINLQSLFSYDNATGTIRGNDINLSTTGNLLLEGKIQGISNLLISGSNITNNGNTISSGLLRLSGNDITNNLTISGSNVELLATGNILNNSMIEGETGELSGNNIENRDLIIFLDKLDIEGTKLVNKDATIYSDDELNIRTADVDNTDGEIVGQSTLNITGFNLLDNTRGVIDSRGNILLSGNKLLNSGEVSGQYRLYWETWDGRIIYDNVWRNLEDSYSQTGNSSLITGLDDWTVTEGRSNMQGWGINPKDELTDINNDLDYKLYYNNLTSSQLDPTKDYKTQVLTGYIDTSQLVTTGARILSGGNLTLDIIELENVNSKISAGGTLLVTDKVQTIKNETTASAIKVYDGDEQVKTWTLSWTAGNGDTRSGAAIGVWRSLKTTGRDLNIADSVSVIEGNNVVIQGSPVISNGYVIQSGAVVDPSTITSRDVDVDLYYDPVTVHVDRTAVIDIINTGIIPFNNQVFNQSISKLFTQNSDPASKYMLETRSQYIDLSRFFGSDYFLSKIGYDESSDWNKARRLGDAYYETKYMNSLLLETLGTRFINGKADTELMKELLDNAVATSGDLQLTIGVSLTKEQIVALKSDIIWYVEQEVNGQKVLVPQLYLSQATLENIKSPTTTISAQETLAINSSTLVNQGRLEGKTVYVNTDNLINKSVGALTAEITGTNIQIDAKNDILNIGAVISAKENLVLTAGGTISNITTGVETVVNDRLRGEDRTYTADNIQNVGLISSGNATVISGENYVSRGAVTQSEGTVYIEAEKDISINIINLKESEREGIKNGYQYTEVNQKLGSEVTGLDNVIMNAGNDVNIKGSSVLSDGTVQISAEKDINIVNDKNTTYHEEKQEKKGTFSSYSKLEKDYKEGAAASTLMGNNVILDAGNDVNVRASNVIAVKEGIENTGGNIVITAGNDVNISTDDMNNEYSLKEKKSGFSTNFSSGGGGATAGVSYSKSSLEINSKSTTVAVSTLISEGNTVLEAGNKVRTEAMQANVGENLIIRGVNGVELLDAKEVYEEKVKQKTTTMGVSLNVGFTPAQLASTVSDVAGNVKDYGFGNTSQSINTIGNGIQDLRDIGGLNSNLRNWYEGIGYSATKNLIESGGLSGSNLRDAAKGLVSASVSLNFSQSSYESNTNGTTSVAGVINVGKNFLIESEGNVLLVNQKINVGENLIVDAKNFEARAGENTYSNNTKSSSVGGSIGYDIVNSHAIGGLNIAGGKSNTDSKYYDNTYIGVGGTFQLTTKDDATFAGVNVTADKINFDIGKNLNVISLQDEYKSDGKNYSAGINVSGKLEGTNFQTDTARPSIGGSYGENHQDSKWTGNQTSILAENGGSIKIGETLTNIGSVIGSLNENEKLGIEAKKVVIENLKDYNEGENYGIGLSGISLNDKKTVAPQTSIQYGSHDKEQNTNSTFVNTEVTEAGKKLNLDELGINTDINKAQVVTKDKVVEQIDTTLHTDLINETTRNQVIKDLNGLAQLPGDIIRAIQVTTENEGSNFLDNLVGTLRNTDANLIKYQEMHKGYENLKNLPDDKKAGNSEKLANDMANVLRNTYGIDEDIKIIVSFTDEDKNGEMAAYERKDAKETGVINIFINVKNVDVSDMEQVYNALGAELSHYNPSNPYVYNKTEQQAGKNNKLEEDFTSIGRKALDGSGNSFYNDILSGSSVLDSGNGKYALISDEDLDFATKCGQGSGDEMCGGTTNKIFIPKLDKCGNDKKCQKDITQKAIKVDKGIKKIVDDVSETKNGKSDEKSGFSDFVIENSKNISTEEEKKEKALKEFRENALYNGVQDNIRIEMIDKDGNKLVFESLLEYQSTGNKEERAVLQWLSDNINSLEEAKRNAKTSEEKKEIDSQLKQYYDGQKEIEEGIKQRGSLGGKNITGNYLSKSATGYDGMTLTVSNEKMSAEVGAEKIGIAIDGMGKIATELWIGKISNSSKTESIINDTSIKNEAASVKDSTTKVPLVKDPVTGRMIEPNTSRVNIANDFTAYTPLKKNGDPSDAGWKHVVKRHFDESLANNRSVFTKSEEEIKSILQSKIVVDSPIREVQPGMYERIVDTGQVVGKASLKQGGGDTTWIKLLTDMKGNLITTFPVGGK
ncbi:hemagglutinin repeat-containing protein, partial [Sebaldella sp. S0638]|uniref:hemagglutinin repeat-containing protein n=1 Tax=Sebaldella sp. S0638 TaxID=2957809 RepID=UPI00209FF672